ncbi:CLAVATA3/ESR (CLE)-related protein [Quillaja saponaria]|uniref:CLAVATA3/ESR (CLE)-related protein n=1 Tax=Quillaja saponaria TaxID=32244 RepID=A0AAD7KNN0_QUISA|nr:CLAVATA3/ESR (CLE)-related protein [Quillaja saponaria]
MALKTSDIFCMILWISLLLFLFREFYNLTSKINNKEIMLYTTYSSIISLSHPPQISRKVLASKFDFTPFLMHHDHHQIHSPDMPVQPEQAEEEIDLRYGVAKHRVPTGPNPLHH